MAQHERSPLLTGGCQCGAVRYALHAQPHAEICHCRMCQKAVGGPFAALASVACEDFVWTRGAPALFNSSSVATRGFCAACGTPLTYRKIASENVSLTLHSLDHPDAVTPDRSFSPEMRPLWCLTLEALPVEPTPEADEPGFVNHQHMDAAVRE